MISLHDSEPIPIANFGCVIVCPTFRLISYFSLDKLGGGQSDLASFGFVDDAGRKWITLRALWFYSLR